jgi:hypothetical protein
MNTTSSSAHRPQSSWFATLRSHFAKAWAIHVRTCEIMAESHRRIF